MGKSLPVMTLRIKKPAVLDEQISESWGCPFPQRKPEEPQSLREFLVISCFLQHIKCYDALERSPSGQYTKLSTAFLTHRD